MEELNGKQNERLMRSETRLDGIEKNISKIELSLSNHITSIYEKLDRINIWLIGLLGGMVVSLVLLILRK